MQPLVAITRSNRIESIHDGIVCVTDSHKNILYSIGDTNTKIFIRSLAKPMQAIPLVHLKVMEKYNISLEELAVICSSHSGEDFHIEAVSSILNKIGLQENDLSCGVANPYNKNMINAIIKSGERPSQLYNCCSGNHAGMLAICKYYNYSIEGYTEPDHPVQQLILKIIAEILECKTDEIILGIDGCSVPTFMLTLHQTAYLYSILALGSNGNSKFSESLGIIQKAMATYPRMINGNMEFCTDLITNSNGNAIGKIGAEGLYCIAVPEKQLGICIKISDGNERALSPTATHLLSQLGILDRQALEKLKSWVYPPIKNHKGTVVGYAIPIFNLNTNTPNIKIGYKMVFEDGLKW